MATFHSQTPKPKPERELPAVRMIVRGTSSGLIIENLTDKKITVRSPLKAIELGNRLFINGKGGKAVARISASPSAITISKPTVQKLDNFQYKGFGGPDAAEVWLTDEVAFALELDAPPRGNIEGGSSDQSKRCLAFDIKRAGRSEAIIGVNAVGQLASLRFYHQ